MTNNTNETKRPTHVIWQVIGESDTERQVRARWIRVGAGWSNKDGKGLTLRFEAYPVAGRTVIREMTTEEETGGRA